MDKEKCLKCEGSGLAKYDPISCYYCDGKICWKCENKAGYVRQKLDTCDNCDGTGSLFKKSQLHISNSR